MEDRDTVIKELKQALKIKSDESEQQRLRVEIVERYFLSPLNFTENKKEKMTVLSRKNYLLIFSIIYPKRYNVFKSIFSN